MKFDIDRIRKAVQEEMLLSHDKISENDISEEFVYEQWIDDDEEEIIIDLDKLYAELLYENMTYHDAPECDVVYPEITRNYIKEQLCDYIIDLVLYNFLDLIEEEGSCNITQEYD